MNSLKKWLLLGTLICAAPIAAQNDQLRQAPPADWVVESEPMAVPEDASGLLFSRRQDILVHLDEQGESLFTGQFLRVLHPQALQAGNVAIVWNPASGTPTVHRLRVHREGTVIDVLETNEFEILRREDQLEQSMLDGLLTAVLRVPDLRVGDDIEFAFTVPLHDPTFKNQNSGVLALADSLPGGRLRLGLSWVDGEEPTVAIPEGLKQYTSRGKDSLQILVENAPTVSAPKDAPPRYGWHRMAQYSDFADWQSISRRFEPMFTQAAELAADSPIKQEAARIASAHSSKRDQAEAALDLVQRQVRYVYVGLGGGNYMPATAEETWDRRYGDCKGKTTLLMALLNELGIEAEAVLVNNQGGDDGADERLPSPALFDHILVRANIDGEALWMDGTLPDVSDARPQPAMPYRWVLPLTKKGSALEAIPFEPFAFPQEMGLYELDARAGFDAPATITHSGVKRGIEGLSEYVQFSALTAEQLETTLRGALEGNAQWNEVTSARYRYDRETQASILTITGTGPVDWDKDGGGAYSLTLPGGGFNPPSRRQRASNQDQNAPFYVRPTYSCYATTVRLPEGTDVKNWGFNSVFDTMMYGRLYYRMMERRDDGTIRMVRGARVERPESDKAQVGRDNGRLSKFDNSKANISYDPDRTMRVWGNMVPVPATYEIDWTAAAAPCLPKDVQ